jgi:hypothetical protein
MTRSASRARSRGLLGSIVLLTTTVCVPAPAGDLPAAIMLFNEARRLAAIGRYADACPKFEESQRLDPGIGTQFNLADCFEHTGRTATAWALFLDVASAAGGNGQQAREIFARKRAAALEARLSKLTIEAPASLTGLEVRRNGEVVNGVLWNSPVPVDPARYEITATAPGRQSWSTLATVGPDGAEVTVAIPTLEAALAPPAPPLEASAPPAAPAEPVADGSPPIPAGVPGVTDESRWTPQKVVALGLGGAAVAGVGIGTFFGLKSIAKHADYERLCAGSVCSPAAASLHADAVAAGNVSTAAFVASGALAAGGAVLWLSAPKAPSRAGVRVAPLVGSSTAGVAVAGDW